MAVAMKNTTEAAPGRSYDPLVVGSLVGIAYVLGSIGLVFHALPGVWQSTIGPGLESMLGSFVNVATLVALMLAAAVGLVYVGVRLAGPTPAHGLRAGIFVGIVGVLLVALVTCGLGQLLESWIGSANSALGIPLTILLGVGLLAGGVIGFCRPTFEKRLIQIEDQGWFSLTAYKRTQGQRVRRGTILGILVLIGAGIWTLLNHRTLNFGLPHDNNWVLVLPFSGEHTKQLLLLADVRFTVPILLAVSAVWLAYRVVNLPAFADFLIATEAELNKVSWTTAKRLKQDTIVVLTAVFLLTLFLFVVDLIWSTVLSSRPVGVLQTQDTQLQKKFDELDERNGGTRDGFLTKDKLKGTLYDAQFDQIDIDPKDGKISFAEFKEYSRKQKDNPQDVPW